MTNLVKLGHHLLNQLPDDAIKQMHYGTGNLLGKVTFGYMLRKGLTQDQLAELSGLPVGTIHKMQGGSPDVQVGDFDKVFDALEINDVELGEELHASLKRRHELKQL